MEYLGLLVMGILLSTLGIVNIMGNISTIHAWNRKRVKEADIPRYGRAIGAGTLVIGAAFIASYLVTSGMPQSSTTSCFQVSGSVWP